MKTTRYIFLSFLLSLVVFSCREKIKNTEEEQHTETPDVVELTADQYRVAGIETGSIVQKQISGTIKVNGLLDVPPQQKISISLPFGGFLKDTELLQGMKVSKGQLIARIENPDFITTQQDYADTESQLEYAKAEYERQKILAAENVNAQKTLQQAKSNYTSLLARFNGLAARLKLLNISPASLKDGNFTSVVNLYAPISGYVTKVNANIGVYLNPTDVLFEIVDTRHLHAELTVFEKDIPRLALGQKVKFTLGNETKERHATVYLIGREIKTDRTINVHCHLDEEDLDLIPGTYLKAYIETGQDEVPALPEDAVVSFRGKQYVFVEDKPSGTGDDHRFTLTEVQTGAAANGYTEIISPNTNLQSSRIVLKGAYDLLSAMKNSSEEHGH